MKTFCGFIGIFVGMFLGLLVGDSCPPLAIILLIGGAFGGNYIGSYIEEEKENAEIERAELERRRIQEQRDRERKREQLEEVITLVHKYPEATKSYFRQYWGIDKSYITDADITEDKVNTLLSRKYSYENDEIKLNSVYKAQKDKEREQARLAEQVRQREEELARQREERERQNIISSLPSCVDSWYTHSYSTLKHKWLESYYSYEKYQHEATFEMWETWKFIWHFKNDPERNIHYLDHSRALDKAVQFVEKTLKETFNPKQLKELTLVCCTASSKEKNDRRFKPFAERVCNDLNMWNAYSHINLISDGEAKHEGGTVASDKSYDSSWFQNRNIVLFDDVRTSGASLEREKSKLEALGATVICAITLAQTTNKF